MADRHDLSADLTRAVIRKTILRASVPVQRLVEIIELIDVCRVGNDVDAIADVCNRLAALVNTGTTVECCRECCHDCCQDCDRVAASTGSLQLSPTEPTWDLETSLNETNPARQDTRTLAIGKEQILLVFSGGQLRICYFSDRDQTGICFMCKQQRTPGDIGYYLPIVYLLPHIHAMYKRIVDAEGHYTSKPIIASAINEPLTPREVTVLRWIAVGKTNWEISRILGLSERTVKFHLSNSFGKLNAVNRAQAVVKARESGALAQQAELDSAMR